MDKKKIFRNKRLIQFGISLLTAIFVIVITQEMLFTINSLKELELNILDSKFHRRGDIEFADSSQVIIVEITQETYDLIPEPANSWPWPRSIFARVVENLTEAGVKAIGIDIVMSNSDKVSPANDELLMSAIKNSGKVVVAGKVNITQEHLQSLTGNNRGIIEKIDENYSNIFFHADSSIGIVQVANDYDGVYRRYSPFVYSSVNDERIPTFGAALLNKYFNLPPLYTADVRDDHFQFMDLSIPKFDNTSMLINFYGSSRTFPYVEFSQILDDAEFKTTDELDYEVDINMWDDPDLGLLHSGKFKNKIVIIGSTMPEDKDILPISMAKGERVGDNLIYGAEFHANAIQNIIDGNYIYRQSRASEILLIFFLTLIVFYFSSFLKRIKKLHGFLLEALNIFFAFLLIVVIYELSYISFADYNYFIPVISPSLAIVFGYFISTAYNFIIERKQNVVIKGMFSQYVSSALVNELIADPDKLQLGGDKKNLTVLFSDIAGFTSFSEKKEPEEVVGFMNEFLNEMSEIILMNRGTLDKYLGDAVMAFWGAPVEFEDHAYLACKTAIEMHNKLGELKEKWSREGESTIDIRIGISTGDVVVGNIGGKRRFDYTVMGDTVNLASRLEGANKQYKTCLMINESTYENVKDRFVIRDLDIIRVKGKSKPTRVFELIGFIDDAAAVEKRNNLKVYSLGLSEYKNRNFSVALKLFEEVYIERSKLYLENPPPEGWDGVYDMKTK